jgi:RNA polymerase sigma factor (sigma-70 family)
MALVLSGRLEGVVSEPDTASAAATVRTLYAERGRDLWAFARRLGLPPDECDDAVQEAHLRLWRSIRDGRAPDDPIAWLYRVLYRLAMDHHRWRRRVAELAHIVGASIRDVTDEESLELGVWRAVDQLPVRQRAAIYLHYRADLEFDRVAAVMGITAGAARTAASRGLGTLRQRFADRVADER